MRRGAYLLKGEGIVCARASHTPQPRALSDQNSPRLRARPPSLSRPGPCAFLGRDSLPVTRRGGCRGGGVTAERGRITRRGGKRNNPLRPRAPLSLSPSSTRLSAHQPRIWAAPPPPDHALTASLPPLLPQNHTAPLQTKNPTAARASAARATATAADASGASSSGRHFAAASGPKPEVVPNPLQAVVPPIIAAISATVRGVQKGVPAAYDAALTSGAAKGAVAFFADRVLLSGTYLAAEHLDLPKWASFLARGGYADRAGWGKIVEAVRPAAEKGDLTAEEAEVLISSLHAADVYDKALFGALAAVLKQKFTEATTEGLCAAIDALASNGHFDAQLWDDAADSIVYCNHYLAATKVPVATIASVFAAYAKYGCDRADLFVSLARSVDEDRLRALPDAELGKIASSLLGSFKKLDFWPDVTEALVLAGKTRAGVSVDAGLAEHAAKKLAAGGGAGSAWLEGGYKDPEHFHGRAFGEYNMYVLRDELMPKYYSPAAARRDVDGGGSKKAAAVAK
jgi:hypothetical protein